MARMSTQSHLINQLNYRSARTQFRLLLLFSVIFTLVGCGIPSRRGPQLGNALPGDYNWNNGTPFWQNYATPLNQSSRQSEQINSADDETDPPEPSGSGSKRSESSGSGSKGSGSKGSGSKQTPDRPEPDELELDRPSPDDPEADSSSRKDRSSPFIVVDPDSFVSKATYLTDASGRQSDEDIEDKIRAIEDDISRDDIKSDDVPLKDELDSRIQNIEDDIEDKTKDDVKDKSAASDDDADEFQQVYRDENTIDTSISFGNEGNSAQLPHNAFYNDPYLLALIEQTMSGNQELKILSEEIRIACNEAYARSGEYRPFVTLGGGVGYDKVGEHTRFGAVENQLEVTPGRAFPEPLGDFLAAGNLSWEIDIWNRLRNSQRAAAMQYLGSQEGRNFIVTRVVSEVAENYYQLLALDSRLENLEKTIEIQKASLRVCERQKKAGRATELSVQRFIGEVEKNRSEKSLIQQEIVEAENRINFLAGRYPQPVQRMTTDFIELNLGVLSSGIPSELLLNRADIREAERNVSAAGLNLEVARARFYPNLALRANLGWNAFRTGYLFRTPESLIYGLAADIVGPLINKRAIQADYRTANAEQLQAIYNYQQTVLEANIEVVNHMTKIENFRRSVDLKKKQVNALEASVEAANRLFQNARVEYVEVLLAQREMMEAKMLMIDTKREQLEAVVNAYQALGGGQF